MHTHLENLIGFYTIDNFSTTLLSRFTQPHTELDWKALGEFFVYFFPSILGFFGFDLANDETSGSFYGLFFELFIYFFVIHNWNVYLDGIWGKLG